MEKTKERSIKHGGSKILMIKRGRLKRCSLSGPPALVKARKERPKEPQCILITPRGKNVKERESLSIPRK